MIYIDLHIEITQTKITANLFKTYKLEYSGWLQTNRSRKLRNRNAYHNSGCTLTEDGKKLSIWH